MARRLGESPVESGTQQQLASIKAEPVKRHAESHVWHRLLFLATSASLVGAIAFSYLQEAGFFGNADVGQADNQPRPGLVSPPPENAGTEVFFTATVESVIASLTPEFHFPGFTGPEFTDRTAENLNNSIFWSVCQEITADNGLAAKLLDLGQALAERLPPGGDIYLCAGAYGQGWRAVDKDGIPLWNQVRDAADPGTKDESSSWHWAPAPNDIPLDGRDWRMESLSKVYQLKEGEYWQRLTVDGDGGVMVEAVFDADGNIVGYVDPRGNGGFHQVEPLATETALPPASPTAKTVTVQPSATLGGEAAATAIVPPKPVPEGTPDVSKCDTSRVEYVVCNVGGAIPEWNSQITALADVAFDDPTIEGDLVSMQMPIDRIVAIVNAGEINLGTVENPDIRKIASTKWSYLIGYDGTFHWTPNPVVWVSLQPK